MRCGTLHADQHFPFFSPLFSIPKPFFCCSAFPWLSPGTWLQHPIAWLTAGRESGPAASPGRGWHRGLCCGTAGARICRGFGVDPVAFVSSTHSTLLSAGRAALPWCVCSWWLLGACAGLFFLISSLFSEHFFAQGLATAGRYRDSPAGRTAPWEGEGESSWGGVACHLPALTDLPLLPALPRALPADPASWR